MVFAALCERIGSAFLWSDKTRTPPVPLRTSRDRHDSTTIVPFTSRADWAARVAGTDPRHISPRQMAELSTRLRECSQLGVEESIVLGFHAELHPDYAGSIGAITGLPPSPDIPRDQLADWEARLAFALTHTPDDHQRIGRIGRILDALRSLANT